MRRGKKFWDDLILGLVFPPFCPLCGKEGRVGQGWACASCWAKLPPAGMGKWGEDERLRSMVKVVFQYGEAMRQIVHQLKFKGRWEIALLLAESAAEKIEEGEEKEEWESIIPIPLHPARRRERGYDQTVLIARALSQRWNIPCREDILVRIRHRPPQSHLPDPVRRTNLAGAFQLKANHKPVPTTRVLMVDDVIHTGTTMLEALTTLQQSVSGPISLLAICG